MKPMKLELIWAGIIAVVALVALLYLGRVFFRLLKRPDTDPW
jgi:hypothetical protein